MDEAIDLNSVIIRERDLVKNGDVWQPAPHVSELLLRSLGELSVIVDEKEIGGHARGRLLQGKRYGKAHCRPSLNPSPFDPGGEAFCPLTLSAMHNFWFALASNKNSFSDVSAILHSAYPSPESPAIRLPLHPPHNNIY